MRTNLAFAVGLVALAAAPATAQTAHEFHVGPRLGYIKYAEETGIKSAAMLGLDGMYALTRNLSVGFRLDIARPMTDGNFFPAEMTFQDTTLLFAVEQPLTVVQYAGKAEFGFGGSLGFFLNGSVGGYRVTLDPQVVQADRSIDHMGFGFGGGISLSTGASTRVRLEVQDFVWRKFNRADLNPVEQRFQPVRFPEVIPTQAPFRGTAHNIHISLAFAFTPGGQQ
jgi:hypothetical protein